MAAVITQPRLGSHFCLLYATLTRPRPRPYRIDRIHGNDDDDARFDLTVRSTRTDDRTDETRYRFSIVLPASSDENALFRSVHSTDETVGSYDGGSTVLFVRISVLLFFSFRFLSFFTLTFQSFPPCEVSRVRGLVRWCFHCKVSDYPLPLRR